MMKQGLILLVMSLWAWVACAQSVFDMPALFPQHKRYLGQFIGALQQGNTMNAEVAVRSALKLFPNDANWNYNLACVLARSGQRVDALAALKTAVQCGFTDVKQLEQDADLASIRAYDSFSALIEEAKTLAANPPKNPTLSRAYPSSVEMGQTAEVTALNTMWNWDPAQGGFFTTRLDLTDAKALPTYAGPYAELIVPWIKEGSAAGLSGFLYVNRDQDRASGRYEGFPGLTPVVYGEEAVAKKVELGLANGLFAGAVGAIPTIGNSVFAVTRSPFWRSLPRFLHTDAAAFAVSARLAMVNQLYVYDATLDYSPRMQGDLLIGQNPIVFLSGDLLNMQKPDAVKAQTALTELLLATVAAMPRPTQEAMLRKGLLVPTLQMLLRKHTLGAVDYFTAEAHPTVFDPKKIDGKALIEAAHTLTPEELPPFFQLAVVSETMPRQQIDFFDLVKGEGVVDSPVNVLRIWRGPGYTRTITLEAKLATEKVSYRWFVVNGDAEKIRLKPLTSNQALMKIEVDWHGTYTNRDGLPTRRVDVACVAVKENGTVSAPAFYSLRSLNNEVRTYDSKTKRLLSINYMPSPSGLRYEDPLLTAQKNWQDLYLYHDDGTLRGWYRKRAKGMPETFDARGRRVLESLIDGTPKVVTAVAYTPRMNNQSDGVKTPVVELLQADVGEPITLNP